MSRVIAAVANTITAGKPRSGDHPSSKSFWAYMFNISERSVSHVQDGNMGFITIELILEPSDRKKLGLEGVPDYSGAGGKGKGNASSHYGAVAKALGVPVGSIESALEGDHDSDLHIDLSIDDKDIIAIAKKRHVTVAEGEDGLEVQ